MHDPPASLAAGKSLPSEIRDKLNLIRRHYSMAEEFAIHDEVVSPELAVNTPANPQTSMSVDAASEVEFF